MRLELREEMLERRADQMHVDGNADKADFGERQDRDDVIGMAGQHQRHAVTRYESARQQAVRETIYRFVDLTERISAIFENEKSALGVIARPHVHALAQSTSPTAASNTSRHQIVVSG